MAAAPSCSGTAAPGIRTPADPARRLEEGELDFILHGQRMRGEWVLFRMKPRDTEKGENWLLIKVEDEYVIGADGLIEAA